MKIESSLINMSSQSSLFEVQKKQESLKFWTGDERPDFENQKSIPQKKDTLELSEQSLALKENAINQTVKTEEVNYKDMEISDKDKQKLLMIQDFIRSLTGKKIKIQIPEKIKMKSDSAEMFIGKKHLKLQAAQTPQIPQAEQTPQIPQKQGWGLEYDYHETNHERQKMSFSSDGIIKTQDGREINFSINLNMSREFLSQKDISIRAGDAVQKDPLVINFDSSTPGLTDSKFSFDIDSDGKEDQISFVSQGNGFLSLDLNNDGTINNGSELFGTNSGNGFEDLAKFDNDGNNWIDENDPIFDKLRIWTKDDAGNDQLFALGQKGIGAIYLGNINTSFDINNSSNDNLGTLQKSGIVVNENGTIGTIHHIDLTV